MKSLRTHLELVRQLDRERERPIASIAAGVVVGIGFIALLYAANTLLDRVLR